MVSATRTWLHKLSRRCSAFARHSYVGSAVSDNGSICRRVDQFHLLRKVGSGYASTVYLGTCRTTGNQVRTYDKATGVRLATVPNHSFRDGMPSHAVAWLAVGVSRKWRVPKHMAKRAIAKLQGRVLVHPGVQPTHLRSCSTQIALKLYHKNKLSELNHFQVAREITIHSTLDHKNIIQLVSMLLTQQSYHRCTGRAYWFHLGCPCVSVSFASACVPVTIAHHA